MFTFPVSSTLMSHYLFLSRRFLATILVVALCLVNGMVWQRWITIRPHSWNANLVLVSGATYWVGDRYEKLFKRCFVRDAGAPNDMFRPTRHQCVAYLVQTGAQFVGGVSVVSGWKGWWKKNDEKVFEHIPPDFKWDGVDQYGQEYAILAGS